MTHPSFLPSKPSPLEGLYLLSQFPSLFNHCREVSTHMASPSQPLPPLATIGSFPFINLGLICTGQSVGLLRAFLYSVLPPTTNRSAPEAGQVLHGPDNQTAVPSGAATLPLFSEILVSWLRGTSSPPAWDPPLLQRGCALGLDPYFSLYSTVSSPAT